LSVALLMAGCAASRPPVPISPEQHAANIAAAQQAGYKVVNRGNRTVFCPTAPPTGSHMAPSCISEADFAAQLGTQRGVSPAARFTNQSPGPGTGAGH